jgi:protoheme IX farnesyltransferase
LTGQVYFYGALVLGLAFLFFGIRAAIVRSTLEARRLLQASVIYLPLLWILMVLNQVN